MTTTTEATSVDELVLTLETLKDLTVSGLDADGVKGGRSTPAPICYCGTM